MPPYGPAGLAPCLIETLRRLGGVPAVIRIDSLKNRVGHCAGSWGSLNEAYRSYARGLGFHIDACLPRCPEDKGKVENKVGVLKGRLRLAGQHFAGLDQLQDWADQTMDRWAGERVCPATGQTVQRSWQQEQSRLRPLPATLPLAFEVAVQRPVYRDCTIGFEGRQYSVPFALCGQRVEVRGCLEVVQVLHEGQVVAQHPRHSPQRIVLDPGHYEGPGTEQVAPPVPLGQLGRKLQEIAAWPVHAAEALAEELSEAVKENRAVHVVLERLLVCEMDARDGRRVKTSLKLSNLPGGRMLGNFDSASSRRSTVGRSRRWRPERSSASTVAC